MREVHPARCHAGFSGIRSVQRPNLKFSLFKKAGSASCRVGDLISLADCDVAQLLIRERALRERCPLQPGGNAIVHGFMQHARTR